MIGRVSSVGSRASTFSIDKECGFRSSAVRKLVVLGTCRYAALGDCHAAASVVSKTCNVRCGLADSPDDGEFRITFLDG